MTERRGLWRLGRDAVAPARVAGRQATHGADIAGGLLGTRDAARVLGITDATLRTLALVRKIPVAAMKGNRRRYARADPTMHGTRRHQPECLSAPHEAQELQIFL